MKRTHYSQIMQRAINRLTQHRKAGCGHSKSRRGVVFIYVAAGMIGFLAIAGYAIDMNFLYMRKARAQRAADAAALAGAFSLANLNTTAQADTLSRSYATTNGYTAGTSGATVTTGTVAGQSNYYRVTLSRPERTFFASVIGIRQMNVGATATALYLTLAPMNIVGGGTYGLNDGPTSLSMFGPAGLYSNGDCYSVTSLTNSSASNPPANPLYTGNGYDFQITVPSTSAYSTTRLWIFDPDCHNKDDQPDAATGIRVDELRKPDGNAGTPSDATTTKYTLYRDNKTPSNPADDVAIWTGSYADSSSDALKDMKWNIVYTFNRNSYPGQNFRLNATTISGSSENGFNLRVGDAGDYDGTGTDGGPNNGVNGFPTNGTAITATGHIPMNFNKNGSAKITLGYVPKEAAGTQLIVRKFDTDVGSTSAIYTCDGLPGYSFSGVLSGNGTFATDSIPLPDNYTGGNWSVSYSASIGDTSVWDMSYTGLGPGQPGGIRLIE